MNGVEKDYKDSKAWFKKAIAGGYKPASERMMELYGIDK
jgi:TPR repeat protein